MGKFLDRLKTRIGNALLTGGGAGSLQDKGSLQTFDRQTLSPYYDSNFLGRWSAYVRMYNTDWSSQKAVRIPVQDALRVPVKLDGIDPMIAEDLYVEYYRQKLDKVLEKALIQERLLGGCVIMGLFKEQEGVDLSEPFKQTHLEKGDFLTANIVDVTRISLPEISNDPFSQDFDRTDEYAISGIPVHVSRLCVLEGNKLFSSASRQSLEQWRYNPCGFGESCLAPLYDLLIRVTGSQEAAFHLINMASCLVVGVDKLRVLEASGSPAADKIAQVVEQLSIYRGAVVDGEGVNFKQHTSSFGSVPELMMSFLHILSAACDIPVTRFMGESPGGLNSTGESDLSNYYNMIESWQESHVKAIQKKLFDWCGCSLYGGYSWENIGSELILTYQPLWSISDEEQMMVDTGYASALTNLVSSNIITPESAVAEMEARNILKTKVKVPEPVVEPEPYKGEF
jgi:phage-related protein (TIGR01555 family)